MENLLIMGVNTRPMVNSALKLDYNTFSVSYFRTYDFNEPYKEKHVLDQESVESCGFFENNYSPCKLLELSKEYLSDNDNKHSNNHSKKDLNENPNESIDKIVLITGIHASDFKGEYSKHRKLIKGNLKTDSVDDKYKFYKKIHNKFNVPLSFKPVDVDELKEILQQYKDNQFILKPLKGNGGLGIYLLNYGTFNKLNDRNIFSNNFNIEDYILQEYIEGTSLSSSVMASHNDRVNIFNTRLITENDLGKDSFEYSGNIIPLDENSFGRFNKINKIGQIREINKKINFNELNQEMKDVSEELIKEFKLIGSNGVDFILDRDNELKVIEINPRFQGTYELCEEAMNINLLDAHIKACEGELIEIPPIERYAVKKIIYARKQVKIGNLNIPNVYDIPYEGVKIESNQPLVTLISSNSNLDKAIDEIKIAEDSVYKNIE